MMLRRLVVGVAMLFGLSVWSWCRADGLAAQTPAPAPDATVCSAEVVGDGGGNHDDAAYRYRTNQPRHWRHVMVGSH